MDESTARCAPLVRAEDSDEGGVRPAARCPDSVRSLSPCNASCPASRRRSGLMGRPLGERGPLAAFFRIAIDSLEL